MKRWLIAMIATTTLTSGTALSGSREPVLPRAAVPQQSGTCSYRSLSIAVPIGGSVYEVTVDVTSSSRSIVLKELDQAAR
jgi:hypothetical protein